MRLLLPPSESKRCGGRGRPLSAHPATGPLTPMRLRLLDALERLLAGDPAAAAAALLLPPAVADAALAADAAVFDSATMPALRRYTGVLYDGLDAGSLPAPEQRVAGRCTLIFSGLWGVVRGDEAVPEYRVPAKAALPGVGVVGTAWRPVLADVLPGLVGAGLVVDLRSTDYAAMWRPPRSIADRAVTVRVLSPLPRGGTGVVSYASKLGKGRLARALIGAAAAGRTPSTAGDVAAAWAAAGGADVDMPRANHLDLYDAPPSARP